VCVCVCVCVLICSFCSTSGSCQFVIVHSDTEMSSADNGVVRDGASAAAARNIRLHRLPVGLHPVLHRYRMLRCHSCSSEPGKLLQVIITTRQS